jgi:hypothetical protein
MKAAKSLSLTLIVLISTSCEQNDQSADEYINCDHLINGIIYSDNSIVKEEIGKLAFDLGPKPTADDLLGHVVNFDTLLPE